MREYARLDRVIGLAVWLTAVLAGCGGDSSSSEAGAAGASAHALTAFDIAGVAADDPAGVAPIDPSADFVVSWSVDDPASLYAVRLAVSADANWSPADIQFHSGYCGALMAECPEAPVSFLDCRIDNSHQIDCGGAGGDLSMFLDTIPKAAYVLIRTCNTAETDCTHDAHQVEFQ